VAGRRRYGEGSITPRYARNGKLDGYQARIPLPNGTRKTVGTFETRREAAQANRNALVAAAAGSYTANRRQTVGEYLTKWLESKQRKYKTYGTYRSAVKLSVGYIGHIRLEALRPLISILNFGPV
jgi:hypothetical protein